MKQTHLLIIVLFVLLGLIGWGSAIVDSVGGENEEYNNHVALAEDYFERGLYQKSAKEYENALTLVNTQDGYAKLLAAYQARYEESESIYDDYLSAAEMAVTYYPECPEFVLTLAQLHVDAGSYRAAYKAVKNALEAGMTDERVAVMAVRIAYSYEFQWSEYKEYIGCVNGYYAVRQYDLWDYMTPDGSIEDLGEFLLAGPVGEDAVRLCVTKNRTILTDADEIVQGIVHLTAEKAGVYAEGLIPVMSEGVYAYYDLLGDKKFGSFEEAGTFQNGKAAVCSNGKWYFIDNTGNPVSGETYEHIVLNVDGTYLKNEIMLAKKNGAYHIYNAEGEQVGTFAADNVDVVTDNGWIAFCKNDKWGYVNTAGEEMIAPAYEGAKSFSYGLAAIYDGEFWGFINENNALVIGCQFLEADYFNEEGSCMVCTEEVEVIVVEEEAAEEETEEAEETTATEPETEQTGLNEDGEIVLEDDQAEELPTEMQKIWKLLVRHVPDAE